MPLNKNDGELWSGIETLTIEEGGFLLYGIEPKSFRYEEEYSYDAHPGFDERDVGYDIACLSEIVERAALSGSIEIVHQVPGNRTVFDWQKTHLKKSSFLIWCKSIPKYAFVTKALDLATYSVVTELQENDPDVIDWKAKAREIADLIAMQRGGGPTKKISAHNVCEAVATRLGELRNPSYASNRGVPYSASAVRTQALKGWQYPPKVD